jgi:hypothetical protein
MRHVRLIMVKRRFRAQVYEGMYMYNSYFTTICRIVKEHPGMGASSRGRKTASPDAPTKRRDSGDMEIDDYQKKENNRGNLYL